MEAHHEINRRKTVVKRAIVMVISVLLALIVVMPMAVGAVGQGSKKASGKTAKLAAAWTQWAYSQPVEESPLIGSYEGGEKCNGTPVSLTPGDTWFLAGTSNGETVVRTCTVPTGKQLFFPVASATFFITEPGETKKIARDYVRNFINDLLADPDLGIAVTVDGTNLYSNRIVRARTSFFTVTFPENNIFGVPAGEYQTISDGLWVTLPPLSEGTHTIHFELTAPNVDVNPNEPGIQPFTQNNTYRLTVV